MNCSTGTRILLIEDKAGSLGELRGILGRAEQSAQDTDTDDLPIEGWPVLEGLEVDWPAAGQSSAEVVRRALQKRRPYLMAVIDLDERSRADGAKTVRDLCQADPALSVLFYSDRNGPPREALAGELGRRDRLLFLDKPLDPIQLRQMVALLIDRRLAGDDLSRLSVELDSTRRALDRAREEVAEAARAKNEFMANISHEIRTPMNAILGFTGLLLKEPLTADQMEKLQYVHRAGKSLLHLINHVLDFSRLTAGQLKLNTVAFNLDDVLQSVVDELGPIAHNKDLAIRCHTEEAVPLWLEGDKNRFRQILFNLVDNAIKFTQQGTIHVRTALDEETDKTATLRVVVTDTGVGIPADRQQVAFDGFSQADGSSTRSFEGVGVGLAICKHLVGLMGGQIGLRSTAGQGSSFWFTATFKRHRAGSREKPDLPSGKREIATAAPDLRDPTAERTDSRSRQPQILVAEDDQLSRTLLEVLLTRAGCIVDLVGNGHEAAGATKKNRYDLVFMDIQMPEIDGLEAIRQIRRQEQATGRHVPIVALTAHAMPGDREQCLQAGADDYMAKPFDAEDLFATLERHVPGVLESSDDEPVAGRTDGPDGSTDPPCSPEQCMLALCEALGEGDFHNLENRAQQLKSLAERSGSKGVVDHAMRVKLAARGGDPARTAAAVKELRLALVEQPILVPGRAPLTHDYTQPGTMPQPNVP